MLSSIRCCHRSPVRSCLLSGTRSAGRMGDPGDKAGWGTLVPSGNVAPAGQVGTHRSPGSARGLCRAGGHRPPGANVSGKSLVLD